LIEKIASAISEPKPCYPLLKTMYLKRLLMKSCVIKKYEEFSAEGKSSVKPALCLPERTKSMPCDEWNYKVQQIPSWKF
jgi:hypothetical protein